MIRHTYGATHSNEWEPRILYRDSTRSITQGFRVRFQHEEKDADSDNEPEEEDGETAPKHEPSEGDEGGGGSYMVPPSEDSNPMGWGAKRKARREEK